MFEIDKDRIQTEVITKMEEIKAMSEKQISNKESFLSRFIKPFADSKVSNQNLKVLICEDCALLSKIIRRVMEKEGFNVTVTATPAPFLTRERLAEFDFIITDNNMPYMLGTQFIEYVEKELKMDIPMYLYSGDPFLKDIWPLTKVRRGIFEKGSGFESVLQRIMSDFKNYKDEMNAILEMKLSMTANTLMA